MNQAITASLFLLALTGCAGWQDTTKTGVDVATQICENELLRTEAPNMIASGMAPPIVSEVINTACGILAATKPGLDTLLAQADQARAPRGRVLAAEAKARGLL